MAMARDIALCSIPIPILPSVMDTNYQTFTSPMTTTTFSSLESSGSDQYVEGAEFEVSDFFSNFEEWGLEVTESMGGFGQSHDYGHQGNEFYDQLGGSNYQQNEGESSRGDSRNGREKKDAKGRIAFRMRSEIDVVEDGYKWRKYGKKMVKNSPNPRNYYRCSVDGCEVKKRVERDREDAHYVITTYEGIHNHEAPRL